MLLACGPGLCAEGLDSICPSPDSVSLAKGSFRVSGAAIKYSSSLDGTAARAVSRLASRLSLVSGKASPVSCPVGLDEAVRSGSAKGLVFIIDEGLGDEEYAMDIQPRTAVIRAGGTPGILYSLQTIRQMLPEAIYEATPEQSRHRWTVPCCTLRDCPDTPQREIRADCASSWASPEELEALLERMARVKLNVLRLVIADDDCWRLQTSSEPSLAQVTAYREAGKTYSGDDIRLLSRQAADLGIRIVPEILFPASLLAELSIGELPSEVVGEVEALFGEKLTVLDGDEAGGVPEFRDVSAPEAIEAYAQRLWKAGSE